MVIDVDKLGAIRDFINSIPDDEIPEQEYCPCCHIRLTKGGCWAQRICLARESGKTIHCCNKGCHPDKWG